jgi:hypothetical protein
MSVLRQATAIPLFVLAHCLMMLCCRVLPRGALLRETMLPMTRMGTYLFAQFGSTASNKDRTNS